MDLHGGYEHFDNQYDDAQAYFAAEPDGEPPLNCYDHGGDIDAMINQAQDRIGQLHQVQLTNDAARFQAQLNALKGTAPSMELTKQLQRLNDGMLAILVEAEL